LSQIYSIREVGVSPNLFVT